MSADDERKLLLALANAIELALIEDQNQFGKFGESLTSYMSEQDPGLGKPRASWGADLNALWHFSDNYFDAFAHGFPDLDKIAWPHARFLLDDAIEKVRRGEPITASEVLRYARN